MKDVGTGQGFGLCVDCRILATPHCNIDRLDATNSQARRCIGSGMGVSLCLER